MKNLMKLLIILITGAFILQGFQCASPNFTSAKLAYQVKDFAKAEDYLNKELTANPKNGEAYLLLSQINFETKQYVKSAENAQKSKEFLKKPDDLTRADFMIQNSWIQCFNDGIKFYNAGMKAGAEKNLDSSVTAFNNAIAISPLKNDSYNLLGQVYNFKDDTANAIKTYEKAIDLLKPEIEFAKQYTLYLDMATQTAISKIGKKTEQSALPTQKGDSIIMTAVKTDAGQEVILTSLKPQNSNDVLLKGWRVDIPKELAADRMNPFEINLEPFTALFRIYYTRQKYEKSLEYLTVMSSLDPTNQDFNTSIVSIYQTLGKMDEALKTVSELTKKDPNNKIFWSQYGDIYQSMDKFDEAVAMYKKALELDKNYDFALRNIATAYKNEASVIQKEQFDKMDKDKTYKGDTTAYFPLLRESADYFKRASETKTFETDYKIYLELVQIYIVLDNEVEMKKAIKNLEVDENLVPEQERENYYYKMLKIYSTIKDTANTERIQNKLKNIK